ncbi:hypothetical protein ACIQMV_08855 [Streptomyces sp. NPDC091412]|uniref:hypothetical protein n=1 Tax=Streptomyces sp. NPDC091412 TaxID=3366002 RepID=UPI0037FF2B8C
MSNPQRKVVRLQQMRAQRTQAAGIKHVDVVYEVPGETEGTVKEKVCSFLTQDYWPVEVVELLDAAEGNKNIAILRRVATPPEAFDELVNVAQLTIGELTDLIKELTSETGTDEGEGGGSSTSSASTPGASVPTSSGTTQAVA